MHDWRSQAFCDDAADTISNQFREVVVWKMPTAPRKHMHWFGS
jgi:hypothetical protein